MVDINLEYDENKNDLIELTTGTPPLQGTIDVVFLVSSIQLLRYPILTHTHCLATDIGNLISDYDNKS